MKLFVREKEKKRSHRDDSISQLVELMREEKKYRHDMQYRILDMMKQRNDAIEQYTMKTDSITQQFNEIKELLNQVLKKINTLTVFVLLMPLVMTYSSVR